MSQEYYVFLDESGDDNIAKYDRTYPIFVLGAVVIEKTYHDTEAVKGFIDFKRKYATPGIILHTVDMLRNRQGFEFLSDTTTRQQFYTDLNSLIERLDFTLITGTLDIPKAIAQWGLHQRTPYIYLLQLIMERIFFCLRHKGIARVFAESRQPHLDALIQAEYQRVCNGATMISPATLLRNLFPHDITFLPKNANPGAELVDLLVTPVGRSYLNRSTPIDLTVIDSKTYKRPSDGLCDGWGRIIQP